MRDRRLDSEEMGEGKLERSTPKAQRSSEMSPMGKGAPHPCPSSGEDPPTAEGAPPLPHLEQNRGGGDLGVRPGEDR